MKKTILQFSLIAIGVILCGYLSSTEFETMKQDDIHTLQENNSVIDMDNDNIHDSVCMCDYCTDVDNDYQIMLGVMDTTNGDYAIYLMDGADTIADLSNNKQLHTIIDEDNL